jgi:hypothetical protein
LSCEEISIGNRRFSDQHALRRSMNELHLIGPQVLAVTAGTATSVTVTDRHVFHDDRPSR